MRITGGELRGRLVTCPKGLAVRPTASKVRQAFFNILGHRLRGLSFLDLFAGTGLMGFEALSRGATSVTFVEQNPHSVRAISQSASNFGLDAESYEVIQGDVLKVMGQLNSNGFDIIFADPPYKQKLGPKLASLVIEADLLRADGLFIVEHMTDDPLSGVSDSLVRVDTRQYGQTTISFFREQS